MLSFRRRARSSSQFSDREQAYAVALIMVGIVLVTVATVAILIEDGARQGARESARMLGPPAGATPDRSGSRSDLGVAEYVNGTHDYGFEYPASWTVHENARITSLENPNGRIRVRFGTGPSSDLETTAARSIHSLTDTSDRDVIGMAREKIDGSSSLLVSGTAIDDGGRPVRFLSITVRGQSKNYAISILVPRRSDPITVLPQIEEIVSSFDVLATGAEISV
jgi:hypothetical protein